MIEKILPLTLKNGVFTKNKYNLDRHPQKRII